MGESRVNPASAPGNVPAAVGGAAWLVASVLFAGFLVYYFSYTDELSFNGGPDEEPHYHAARFIEQHGRMAVYPDDEARLYFSRHGTTRSFRPPFAYLTGVGAAKSLDVLGIQERARYRIGSAVLGALAVALVFLAAAALCGALWISLFGALSFGLLPQFTFLSAYFNDDVAAVTSVALLVYGLVLMLRRGVGLGPLLLVGVATGLIIISKPSAWAVSFGLLLGLPWLMVRDGVPLRRALAVMVPVILVSGGWWIAFNMSQHGIGDPLNWGVERALGIKYRDLPEGVGLSYAAQGVTLLQLLSNYDNFLIETYKSAVGNLDWLRLEMGPLQYGFYGALLSAAGAGAVWFWISPRRPPALPRLMLLVFLISLMLQIAAYFWINLHRDSQAQGRYLLPAAPIVVLLMCGAVDRLSRVVCGGWLGKRPLAAAVSAVVAGLTLTIPVYVHLNGLVHRVLPFYQLAYYYRLQPEDFVELPAGWEEPEQTHQLAMHPRRRSVVMRSSGPDPWLVLDRAHTSLFHSGVVVRVTLESRANGTFAVYWDEGRGLSEALSARRHFNIGHQVLYLYLPTQRPQLIRVDPLAAVGEVIVYEIAVARAGHPPLTVSSFIRQWLGA